MAQFQLQLYADFQKVMNDSRLLAIENENLKKLNESYQRKIKQQSEQLNLIQNSSRIKNEQIKEMTVKLCENGRKIASQDAITAQLRKKIGELQRQITSEGENRFALLGKIKRFEEKNVTYEKENAALIKTHNNELMKMTEDYEREIEKLNHYIKTLNENIRNSMQEKTKQQLDEDLYRTLIEQLNSIELLEKRNKKDMENLRICNAKQKEASLELSRAKFDLRQVEQEKMTLIEQLNILKTRSRNDLEDITCLICQTDMNQEEHDFQCLPKCNNCQRRYHTDCLSGWFREKKICPLCKAETSEMSNIDSLIEIPIIRSDIIPIRA